jgi:hypothetical protein
VNRGPAIALLAWAGMLAALAGMLWIWVPELLVVALLGGAAIATAALGVLVALRRPPRDGRIEVVPDLSLATALVALAAAAMLLGAEAGVWLVLIGAGMLVFGMGALTRELAAERRARQGKTER